MKSRKIVRTHRAVFPILFSVHLEISRNGLFLIYNKLELQPWEMAGPILSITNIESLVRRRRRLERKHGGQSTWCPHEMERARDAAPATSAGTGVPGSDPRRQHEPRAAAGLAGAEAPRPLWARRVSVVRGGNPPGPTSVPSCVSTCGFYFREFFSIYHQWCHIQRPKRNSPCAGAGCVLPTAFQRWSIRPSCDPPPRRYLYVLYINAYVHTQVCEPLAEQHIL